MHALGYIIFLCLGFTIVRQQIVTIENQVRKTYQADDDADLSQFEHTHSLSARFLYQSVNNQVSACADEGTDAAQHGGVTQGNEKLRVRQSHFPGPVLDDGCKDDHDWCVVEEGRQRSDGWQKLCIRPCDCCLFVGQKIQNDSFQDTAATYTLTNQEKQSNSNHAFIGKAFQALFGL